MSFSRTIRSFVHSLVRARNASTVLVVAACVLGLLMLVTFFKRNQYITQSMLLEHREQGIALLTKVGAPPTAEPLNNEYLARFIGPNHKVVSIDREYWVDGVFGQTVAWYAERLKAHGFRPVAKSDWTAEYAMFCRDEWFAALYLVSVAKPGDPLRHQFKVLTRWDRKALCPE